MNRTHTPRPDEIDRRWWVIDLEGKTLGRAAAAIAHVLIGKHKPDYTPHLDNGDFVVAVNCDKIHVTGKKLQDKMYYRHSGYPGSMKEFTLEEMMRKSSGRVMELAVKNMLPKNRLGRAIHKKLKTYSGPDHPHSAQRPDPFPDKYIKTVKEVKVNG